MNRPKLTKSIVDGARPKEREYFLWDGELRGFGLKILPSGKKVFTVFYRTESGRQRRPTIGVYGVLTPAQARDKAIQWLADAAHGGDPAGSRQQKRSAATVKELGERYLSDHAEIHKKPSSIAQDRRMLQRQINPNIGQLKVEAVDRADVVRFHHQLRQTPYEANRCLALLSKMFSLSELWGLRADGSNPCLHVKKYEERARNRFFTSDELERIGGAIARHRIENAVDATALDVILLLALTGCRLGEITNLQWPIVKLDEGAFDLPDSKTGAKRVPLGRAAVTFIEGLRKQNDLWVFPRVGNDGPISRWKIEDTWKTVRKKAGIANARIHDLRHTVGTYSGQSGANAFFVRDLLGHKTLAMTSRYVSPDLGPIRTLATQVSERIAKALALPNETQA